MFTLNVCLNELYSLNVKPLTVLSMVSNEWNPTGMNVLKGIKKGLSKLELDIPINGSTEENFKTSMTAYGMAVFGYTENIIWRNSKENDHIYLIGIPYVGEEVIKNQNNILNPKIIAQIIKENPIGDFLPCGSGGIYKELEILSKENELKYILFDDIIENKNINIKKSAGPATCGIFTSKKEIKRNDIPLFEIGRIKKCIH
ncbi:hypothetical protein OF820_05075 [Oceanotoga sp. DSM 15011]|jgi:hypothetical protein|uniref:Alpha-ribazole kinase n=1 Tax=Oceanotoga teriensis TaxID=515440 RepID=A0AA45C7J2_9BACT|nr:MULTISPECIES: hypothetical protein [Oceanotoga]MDN5342150.1 hypothetical protein [Oceanotoga sp.]MDO7976222.1 hypothetical protein [Oceanotoga teriensis]PWJ95419.1 alpha-ribazole kinase [Oceanotoga teriensis]UYP01058.1 hypothetical protein OF820_05075 [Oceanotoga sp. DSM 15011]